MEVLPQGLLNFIYELPSGYNDFPAHVLRLIDKHVGYHLLTFIPLNDSFLSLRNIDPKIWINEYRTLGLSREVLELYNLRGHKIDIFRANRLPQHLWKKAVIYAEDAFPPGELYRSEYGQFLTEMGVPYQVALNLTYKNIRLGVISIYRTLRDGPFTQRDDEILNQVSRFVSQHYMMAMARTHRNMATDLFKTCYKNLELGVVMVDHNFMVVDKNAAAEQFANQIIQTLPQKQRTYKGLPSAQQSNLQTIIRTYNNSLFYSDQILSIPVGEHAYEFHVGSFVSSTSNLSRVEMVYLIFISKVAAQTLPKYDPEMKALLTDREWQIVDQIAKGLTNDQIARQFSISIHTVKSHILNIYKKVNVTNRTSLLRTLESLREDMAH